MIALKLKKQSDFLINSNFNVDKTDDLRISFMIEKQIEFNEKEGESTTYYKKFNKSIDEEELKLFKLRSIKNFHLFDSQVE